MLAGELGRLLERAWTLLAALSNGLLSRIDLGVGKAWFKACACSELARDGGAESPLASAGVKLLNELDNELGLRPFVLTSALLSGGCKPIGSAKDSDGLISSGCWPIASCLCSSNSTNEQV